MKIKSLLIGMLACTALVGCSDDDVLNNAEMGNQQAEKMRAYMTFSIASSTNSSRGVVGGTTVGDGHGNQEHSGHETLGTKEEQKVNSILICFYNTDGNSNDGFSHLFTMTNNSSEEYEYMTGYSTQLVPDGDGYRLKDPIAINSTGTYNVMVAVNPSDALTIANATDKNGAKAIYDEILDGTATSVSAIIGSQKNNFMMTNRKSATITVTEDNNDPSNPAGKDAEAIEVERVVSKITFRPTKLSDTEMPSTLGSETNDGTNVYKINETVYKYDITKSNFWFKDTDGIYRYLTNLYKAEDPKGKVYWVHIVKGEDDKETTETLYEKIECPQEDDIEGGDADDDQYSGNLSTGAVKAYVVGKVDTGEIPETYVYVGSKEETGNKIPYYLKLTGYTLVNQNNEVHYVRHTSKDMVTGAPWGFVNSNNTYIFDPHSKDKSAIAFASTNPLVWDGTESASTYYNNDFATVAKNIANGTHKMSAFGTAGSSDVEKDVTPKDPKLESYDPEYNTTGSLLDYCLENAVLSTKQNALTSTGIIFEAQIYDKNGEALKYMLEWNGSFFKNFLALQEATKGTTDTNGDGTVDIADSPFWKYADEDYPSSDTERKKWAEALAEEEVILYHDGKCYYFSSEIEHFDNDTYTTDENGNVIIATDGGQGVMENAIMRNNVYSLSVNSVNKFGFSSINLESGVLEGEDSGTEQEKLYLTMKAKILPWIVRFNNINF